MWETTLRGKQRTAVSMATGCASLVGMAIVAAAVTFADSAGAPAPGKPLASTPAVPPATPEITILNNREVEGILGREVRSATNENMGRIVDVLVDRSGQVRAAIIDFGGFLGVGSRKIAVDWNALHFPPPGQPGTFIKLELTRDQVATAPEYQEGKPVVILGALGTLEPLAE
jgi:hypothetical protein